MNVQMRIAVEKRIVNKTIDALIGAGYLVSVWDGEGFAIKKSSDKLAVMAAVGSTDEDTFKVYRLIEGKTEYAGFVFFVYGNDGYDVINDYSVDLENVMKSVNDYAESQERLYA